VAAVIADYQLAVATSASADAIRHRLAHVVNYIATLKDKAFAAMRSTSAGSPSSARGSASSRSPAARTSAQRSPATIENSVLQLQAAIRWAGRFRRSSRSPNRSHALAVLPGRHPDAGGDVPLCDAAAPAEPAGLPAAERGDVGQARRDHGRLDGPERGQWQSGAGVQPQPGRPPADEEAPRQVPVPECVGEWLDTINGPVVAAGAEQGDVAADAAELGIPFDGEGGMKLIRRSMMTLARKRLGEEHWIQGRMMAGHVPMTVSDIYALPDPANLGPRFGGHESHHRRNR
jgi:hypothetical protein